MDESRTIRCFEDLLVPFREGCKGDLDLQLLGAESEKFGVLLSSGQPVSYDGRTCGVVGFFEALVATGEWTAIRERDGGPIIALERTIAAGKQQVSLEPGAQLELSDAPHDSVHAVADALSAHLADIAPLSESCGVRWLSAGYHPLATPEQLPWVPKQRYAIMREYFPTVGSRGLDMMRRTATVQVNIDYADEQDAVRKLRVGAKLSPIATAIFANSPFVEGRVNGGRSERALVWTDTDRHRCGLLPFMMDPDASFSRYAEWALGVPMYMFKRDGGIVANTGQSFRSFWEDGFEGHKPTLADWVLHLNTLFPEVRLQRTIELRSTDAQHRSLSPAVPALWAGLLYDEQSLHACDTLIAELEHDALEAARVDIARRALGAQVGGKPIRRWAERMIELSLEGLARRNKLDADGRDERRHLQPIVALVESGRCPADVMLEGFDATGQDARSAIIERTAI